MQRAIALANGLGLLPDVFSLKQGLSCSERAARPFEARLQRLYGTAARSLPNQAS